MRRDCKDYILFFNLKMALKKCCSIPAYNCLLYYTSRDTQNQPHAHVCTNI